MLSVYVNICQPQGSTYAQGVELRREVEVHIEKKHGDIGACVGGGAYLDGREADIDFEVFDEEQAQTVIAATAAFLLDRGYAVQPAFPDGLVIEEDDGRSISDPLTPGSARVYAVRHAHATV